MATKEENKNDSSKEEKNAFVPPPLKSIKTPQIYAQQSSSRSKGDICVLGSPDNENQQYDIFYPDSLKGTFSFIVSENKQTQIITNTDGRFYKYDYRDLHSDLEKQIFCGVYGWDNACYWGIAERKAKTDLTKHYTKRHAV